MDSVGEQNNFGVGDVGKIGDDPFYRFPSKLREPWRSIEEETNSPQSYMEYDDDPEASGGAEPINALQVVRINDTDLGVRKGTVNNVVPTISGTPLDDDVENNVITVGAATTLWLKATNSTDIDTDGIEAVSIETSDPGSDTSTQAKQTLGSCGFADGAISSVSSNLSGSQNVDSCGTFHSWGVI